MLAGGHQATTPAEGSTGKFGAESQNKCQCRFCLSGQDVGNEVGSEGC